ncbi:MAG TPA: Wzz/FepE/Etk N-terminal domain-containing protein [Caldilineaceae bacterium]|nr:Wzz/FepE/Etk N-terminal domain-containing protein [Caldilineaceae bacterium]
MTIQEYLRILRRRGWIIVTAMILAAAAAFGISYLQEEMYRATVYVSTVPARPDWGLGNTAKDLMRNFAANLQTPEIAQRVIDRAQLDQNPYDFLSNVTVAADSSDFTIRIEARARDGEVAKLMALTLADEFVEERTAYYAQQDKADRIEVKIRSRAISYELYQPKPLLNAIAGAVLGLLLGGAVVLALTWMESDLLRTPAALERALGVPVLGAIPVVSGRHEAPQTATQPGRLAAPKTA